MTEPWNWTEADVLQLITDQVQESLTLDYKECLALRKTDRKKDEISKDVSAFANSAGGVIVYGVKETGHIPTAIDDGYDPSHISKEWLEQVIDSRIQRRIDGIRINPIRLSGPKAGKVMYVVSIPQSTRGRAHGCRQTLLQAFQL
jgi:predicted HTH transcriptional regulator